jgi:hypothetical protein
MWGEMWRSERLHDYYMTAGCGGRCGDLNAFMIVTLQLVVGEMWRSERLHDSYMTAGGRGDVEI